MYQKPIFIIILILTFFSLGESIKFSLVLQQRQMQCFHEPACNFLINKEKGTRYQIDIKANSPFYGLQVNEHSAIHTDTRGDQEYKFFSAFANTDIGITFCVNSLTDSPIELQLQFYHGFYVLYQSRVKLQNTDSLKDANEFLSMTKRMQEISGLIKMNYQKYAIQILERQPFNNRIEIYSTFAILFFLMVVASIKIWYLNKTIKFMRARKMI